MATEGDPGRARPRSTRAGDTARRRTPSGGGGGAQARRWALALVVALVIGLVIGLIARGGGSTKTTTVVSTVTAARAPTTTTGVRPSGAAARPTITLAVLNGAGVNGIAHSTASNAQKLGYTNVATGDAPHQSGPSVVYFRTGSEANAAQVGKDLKIAAIKPLPATGPIATAAPASAQVIAVLGAG